MKCLLLAALALSTTISGAQPAAGTAAPPPPPAAVQSPVPLEWTPPALDALTRQAAMKENFTLDRNMLNMAAGMLADKDAEDREVIRKLDGVSVHLLRFDGSGVPDEGLVSQIRDAYHLRGWKHLATTTASGGPLHDGNTDVWVVLDGANVRGAVVLSETARSVTLVTVAGNLSPVDILHLRGHFGIPRFDEQGIGDPKGK